MSGSRFSGGSGAQAGGSGFSNTNTSGSGTLQLKKVTLKSTVGKLIVSPDAINFLITGADGNFYDSSYKGDSISLPVTSVFPNTSVTGFSSLTINKNGLNVPVFDLKFGRTDASVGGASHGDYTRQISIDTSGLTIPYTDAIPGILNNKSYGSSDFGTNVPVLKNFLVGLASGTYTFPVANQPKFDDTTGSDAANTISIDTITLTVNGANDTATIDSVTCYSNASRLVAGDRMTIDHDTLLAAMGKITVIPGIQPYIKPYIFSTDVTTAGLSEEYETSQVSLDPFGGAIESSILFSPINVDESGAPKAGGGTGLSVKLKFYNSHPGTNIIKIEVAVAGSGYRSNDRLMIASSSIETDPKISNVSANLFIRIKDSDFPTLATLEGSRMSFLLDASQVGTAPVYRARDFSMTTGGINFPVTVKKITGQTSDDPPEDITVDMKEIANIGTNGYFMPTGYDNSDSVVFLKITSKGLFGQGVTLYDTAGDGAVKDGNYYVNTTSGNCKFYDVTANSISGIVSGSIQPNISSLAGLLNFGEDNASTTVLCNSKLESSKGLLGNILTAEQSQITKLTGITELGSSSASNPVNLPGNLTIGNNLVVNGGLSLGASANLTATNISGTLTTGVQPNLTNAAGLTSFGTSGVTTTAEGDFTIAGTLSVSAGNLSVSNITGTNLTGTITTTSASQPNITTLAGLTSLGSTGVTSIIEGSLEVKQDLTAGNLTATNLTTTISTPSQPNLTSLTGLETIGAAGVTTTCKGPFHGEGLVKGAGGLEGVLNSNSASQPNITTATGVSTLGMVNTSLAINSNTTTSGTLNVEGGGNVGTSTTHVTNVYADNLYGPVKDATQSSITTLPKVVSIGDSTTTTVIQGDFSIIGDFTVDINSVTSIGTLSTTDTILHVASSTNASTMTNFAINFGTGTDQGRINYNGQTNQFSLNYQLHMNSTRITGVAAPVNNTDAANKLFVEQQVNSINLNTNYLKLDGSNVDVAGFNMTNKKIYGLATPTSSSPGSDAATKAYVDGALGTSFSSSGGSLDGNIIFSGSGRKITNMDGIPTHNHDAANKQYVDNSTSGVVKTDGSAAMQSSLNMNSHKLLNVGDPTLPDSQQAISGQYLKTEILHNSTTTGTYAGGFIRADGTRKMTGNLDLGKTSTLPGFKIVNVKAPQNDDDATTKKYVDDLNAPLQTSLNGISTDYLKLDGSNLLSDLTLSNRKITNLGIPTSNTDAVNKSYVDEAIEGGTSGIDDTTRRINGLTGRMSITEMLLEEKFNENKKITNGIYGKLVKLNSVDDHENRLINIESEHTRRMNTIQGSISLRMDDHSSRLTYIEDSEQVRINTLQGHITNSKKELQSVIDDTLVRINSADGKIKTLLADTNQDEGEKRSRINSIEGKLKMTSRIVGDSETRLDSLESNVSSHSQKLSEHETTYSWHYLLINNIHGELFLQKKQLETVELIYNSRINTLEGRLSFQKDSEDIITSRINTIEGRIWSMGHFDDLTEIRLNTLEGYNRNKIDNQNDEGLYQRVSTLEGRFSQIPSFDPDSLEFRINSVEGRVWSMNDTNYSLETRLNSLEGLQKFRYDTENTRLNTIEGHLRTLKIDDHSKLEFRLNTIQGDFNIKLGDHTDRLEYLEGKYDSRLNTLEGKLKTLDLTDLTDLTDLQYKLYALEGKVSLIKDLNHTDDLSKRLSSLEGKMAFTENDELITRISTMEGSIASLDKFDPQTILSRLGSLEGSFHVKNAELNTLEEKIESRINSLEGVVVNKTTTDSEAIGTLENKLSLRINGLEGFVKSNTEESELLEKITSTNTLRGEFTGKFRELQEGNQETEMRLNTLEGAIAMKTGGADEEHVHDSGTKLSANDAFTSASASTDINMDISSGMEISAAISKMDLWLFSYLFDKPPSVSTVTATSYPTYVDVQWTNPVQLQAAFMAVKLPHIVNIVVQIQVQSQNTWTNVVDSVIANQTNRAQLYLTSSSVSESSGATYVKKVLQTGTNYNLRIYADNLSDRALNYYSHGTLIATLSIGIPSLVRNLNLSSASSSSITIIFTNPQRFNTNLGDASSQNNEPNLDIFAITWTPTGLQTPGNRYNAQDNYSTTGSYNLNASVQTQNGTHTRNISNSLPPNYKFDVSVKVKNVENTTGGTNNDGYSDTITSSFNTSDLAYSVSTLGNISVSGTQYSGRALNDTSHSNIFSSKPSSLNNIGYFRINSAIGTQSAAVTTMKSYIGTSAPGASDWVALGDLDGFPVKGYSAFSNANISATPSVSDQETDPYKTGYWLKANLSSLNFDAGLTIDENTTYTVGIQQTIGGSAVSKTDNFIYETGLQQPVAGNMYAHEITGSTIFRYVSGIPMISSGTSWGFSVNMQHVARFFFPQNRRLFLVKIQNNGNNVGSSIYLNSNTATFYEITALSDNKVTATYSTPNDGTPFREFTQFQSTITFSPSNALYEDLTVYGLPYSIWNTYNGGSNTATTGKYGTTDKTLRSDQKSYNIIDNWNTSSKGTWYKITADPHGLSGLSSSGNVATYDHDNCGFFRNDDRNLHMYNGELRFPATNNYTGYHLPSYNWGSWANTDFNYTSVTGGRTAMYTALNNNSSSAGTYRYVLFRYQNVLNNADRTDNLNIVIHGISDSSGSSNVTSPKTSGVTPFNIVNNFELFIKLDGTITGGKVGGSAVESGWWDVNHGAMNLAYQFGNVTNHIGTGNGGGVCQAISYSSGNLNYEAKFPADTVADVWVLVGTTNTVAFDYISIS